MKTNTSAFTLIELLVVITIIAILASIAFPVFNTVTERANQTKDLSNIRQVGVALKLFAGDNNGSYPTKVDPQDPASADIANANDAFRNLFPTYLSNEEIFSVKGSAYTKNTPDNRIEQGFPYVNTLAAGENSYSYIKNLTETSNGSLPLVADGFAAGPPNPPAYVADKTLAGGVWGAKRAIVLNCDGSASNLVCNSTMLAPSRTSSTGAAVNIFATTDPEWLGATNTALNPLPPP